MKNNEADILKDYRNMKWQPLAERMRPKHIDEYVGQSHLLSNNKPLYQAIVSGKLHSMILWGPPGTGKTTLARLMHNYEFIALSAVMAGVKDIRNAVSQAQENWDKSQHKTILFVDEVHRFNKAQQDAFLPFIEDGTFIFIGATTENPSFELNNALLSRARVYLLKPLTEDELKILLERCLIRASEEKSSEIIIAEKWIQQLVQIADGDARRLYNLLDLILEQGLIESNSNDKNLLVTDDEMVKQILVHSNYSPARYDKGGDIFYDQISAFHKSIRGSSPDAALYWMSRMLDAGCDPLYIARRLLAIASEDIGNADPKAMTIALNAWDAFHRLGPKEGNRAIAQATIYCAVAPKSNAVYTAFKAAMTEAKNTSNLEVPIHLRNAPTKLLSSLEHGKDYRYAHDEKDAFAAGQTYFPEQMGECKYYYPVERGLEIKIKEKLKKLSQY